jgi:hypothetical protein
MTRTTLIVATVVSSLFSSAAAIAQSAPTPASGPQPALKMIGVPTSAKPEMVPSLIVMNSRGATLQGDKLTLTGVSPNSIVFADRPVRAAGHALTTDLLDEWKSGDSFGKDPPNATVSALSKDSSTNRDAVVVLKTPKLDGDKLTFDVQVLEGNLNGADGPAAVFIDIIGRPLTPMSFAGVGRRTAFRGAMYAGAATAGAAAAGAAAAAYYQPYGYPPPPPACGYYPYPPCY